MEKLFKRIFFAFIMFLLVNVVKAEQFKIGEYYGKYGEYIFVRQEICCAGESYHYGSHGVCGLPTGKGLRMPERILRSMCDHLQNQGRP